MAIRICTDSDAALWDQFVASHAESTSYHRWNWKSVFENTFHWSSFYLLADTDHHVRGILPLLWQKSLFGSYLSSMPHLKGGGIVAEDRSTEFELLARAVEISRHINAAYLELRHSTDRGLPLVSRDDKVGAVLAVVPDPESLLRLLGKKTRNLVRKSMTFGMTAEFGGCELLNEFYVVYRRNMRDLGSPAYSRRFFLEILSAFPEDTHICAVRRQTETVAAAFVIGFRDTFEVAWASSHRRYLALKPNMFLYWQLLCFAARNGYRWFDFGRSSTGSGTYEFKMQWGAQPVPLHWDYWLADGDSLPSTSSSIMHVARRIWQHLPLPVTNIVGPRVIRFIPGI
jgi:serine/alanine adding enzyme